MAMINNLPIFGRLYNIYKMACSTRSCLFNSNVLRYSSLHSFRKFTGRPTRPFNPPIKILKNRSISTTNNTNLMRAIVLSEFGKPTGLNITEVPKPELKESEVLIRVEAAGINPVDVHIRQGLYKYLPPLPAILGKEVAGVIVNISENAKSEYDLQIGDRVFARLDSGGYAEYVATHIDNVFPLSDNLTFSQGASLYVTYFTAYRALKIRSQVKKTDRLLIHGGSGGVGTAAIQIAKHLGVEHIGATAGTERGLELIKELGANYTFNHRKKGHMYEAKLAVGGDGFDLILENAADRHLGDDINVLGPKGKVAVIGSRGQANVTPRSLMACEGRVFGVNLGMMSKEELDECTKFILKGTSEGWIKPIIGREYAIEEAVKAHSDMILKMTSIGNLVFRMDIELKTSSSSISFSSVHLSEIDFGSSSEFKEFINRNAHPMDGALVRP